MSLVTSATSIFKIRLQNWKHFKTCEPLPYYQLTERLYWVGRYRATGHLVLLKYQNRQAKTRKYWTPMSSECAEYWPA